MATFGYGEKMYPQNNIETVVGSLITIVSVCLLCYCMISMRQISDLMNKSQNEYK